MKKFLVSVLLLFFVLKTFSQQGVNNEYTKEYYLEKSKGNKTAGWILFGGGTAMIIGGGIIASRDLFGSAGDIGGGIFIAGVIADVISIPCFTSAHRFKKKAASVAITNQKILWPQKNSIGFIAQPSVTIRVGL